MLEQCQGSLGEEGIEEEDRHQDGEGRIRMWEVRVPDRRKDQGMERSSQQEEGIQLRCHACVIAQVTERGKAQFSASKRTSAGTAEYEESNFL